ncbi:MAG: hypothetical protein JSS62_03540 [Verrucomicrobia bacterium]|nr:hypothetical protein [Verrucomicrobiota bacterium]MBS0645070.1 hypothetical protein [Verrucomicrobiota bacterium]
MSKTISAQEEGIPFAFSLMTPPVPRSLVVQDDYTTLVGKWFFKSSQVGHEGYVSVRKVEELRQCLKSLRVSYVVFNCLTIKPYLKGGVCSVLVLDFIRKFVQFRDELLLSEKKLPVLCERLSQLGNFLSKDFENARTLQAAFNTIEVLGLTGPVDYSKWKIEALVSYYGLSVGYASHAIDMTCPFSFGALKHALSLLSSGIFLIRILRPSKGRKLEKYGHSLLYIHYKHLNIFYDPNYGARDLNGCNHAHVLFENFKQNLLRFQVSEARFYKIKIVHPPTRSDA